MAARSGRQFLERLAAARVHVEIGGETLTGGIADHPAFRNVVNSYAELFDMQHDPAYSDVLTYSSPTSGEPVATSFLVPRTPEDLAKRRRAFKAWADRSLGMLGRTGDYLNSAVRVLLLRRPGAHGRRVCRRLRPRALQGRGPGLPGPPVTQARTTARSEIRKSFIPNGRLFLSPHPSRRAVAHGCAACSFSSASCRSR